ncbi:uncharacterized protein LOC131153168 [Malania oleifera]|uniref:uncharacterized protein LOC131153168 n=1 Tax=Malania oleifera TaxID=397392 RepID=UPI0025AE30D5|nr:uncharacterized protein LOC131153168 [Malania oleifera]
MEMDSSKGVGEIDGQLPVNDFSKNYGNRPEETGVFRGDEFSAEDGGKEEKIIGNCERINGEFVEVDTSGIDDKGNFENLKSNECGEAEDNAIELNTNEKFSVVEIEKREINGEEHQSTIREESVAISPKHGGVVHIIRPHEQLPKPEAPPGLQKSPSDEEEKQRTMDRLHPSSETFTVDVPAIGKFIRERSNSFSAAIAKRLSSLKENNNDSKSNVTEFNLSGLKVIVQLKKDDPDLNLVFRSKEVNLKGQISFFSRSNCRDCTAVRNFFREKGLKFVEINVDVYPLREKELIQRTGSSSVPQIFFNDKLLGGLVALNSLRNSGLFEQRLREMLAKKFSGDAPEQPVYGFDDPEEERTDGMIGIVRVLRQRLPIQDRLMKMKIVKNCFAGSEMVEVMIQHLDCGRRKAVEIGKELARRQFIHHVFGEKDFEDGNHFYRFLEHEPFIPRCFNVRGSMNDCEPKPATVVNQRLTKIMAAILESYASDDRNHVNYEGISKSEEFRRYVNLAQELHRVDLLSLLPDEKMALFLNLHNAMVIHAVVRGGRPERVIDRRSFFSDFQYLVGGHAYSLTAIKNGILRNNRRPPYSLVKPFGTGDRRLELAFPKINPLVHFGLCYGTRSSPTVRFFTPEGVDAELRSAAREFFQRGGMEVDLDKRTVHLTRIIKWFNVDFGPEKEILKWIISYLDATKAGLLMHLLGDGGPVNIVYQNYDWSMNT